MSRSFWEKTDKALSCLLPIFIPLWLLLMVVLGIKLAKDLNSTELAGWVQAIGSIFGLAGAAFFPVWHADRAEQRRKRDAQSALAVIVSKVISDLWLLTNCLADPVREKDWMIEYLRNHRDSDFSTSQLELEMFSAADLSPGAFGVLKALREAVDVANKAVKEFPSWIDAGHSHPDLVQSLRGKRDLLMLLWATYSGKPVDKSSAVHIGVGQRLERANLRPAPKLHRDVRIHCCYCTREQDVRLGLMPYAILIQVIAPYGKPCSTLFYREKHGWKNLREIDAFVISTTDAVINSWEHDPRQDQ